MPDHYCTLADVNDLAPQVPFTPTSKPSDAIVTAIIADVANEIDATLATLYQVPVVSGTQALQYLRNLCTWGALGRAQEARTTATAPEAAGIKSVWTKKFEEGLAKLIDPENPFRLVDAPDNGDDVPKVASQIVDSNVLSFPDADSDDDDNLGTSRPTMGDVF